MIIKQALDDLRKFTINDVQIFDRLLDILYELHNRQHVHGNLITELQREINNNPLNPNWLDPSEKLKPCPFCAGQAELADVCNRVMCNHCKTTTRSFETDEEAIKFWNDRHQHGFV